MKSKENLDPSKEFLEKKEILELELRNFIKKHEFKMEELKYLRESNKLHHERELERERIKSAEIRKNLLRKQEAFKY